MRFLYDLDIALNFDRIISFSSNLSLLFPSTQPLIDIVKRNRALWIVAKDVFQKYAADGIKGLDVLMNPNFENDVFQLYQAQKSQCST
jgi:hypothetical protein